MTTNKLKNNENFNILEGNVKENNTFCNQKREEHNTFCKTNSQDLTQLWKKGELEEYKKYYCKTKWFEDIFQTRCYNKDTEDEWWVLKNEKYNYNNIYHTKDIEVLAPVPSYEEWQQMKAFCEEFNALNVAEENRKLKQLLKECREYVVNTPVYPQGDDNKQAEIHRLVDKINEVLK